MWPDNLPVMNAFLMSSSLFLGLVARKAVAGLEPLVLTLAGSTF